VGRTHKQARKHEQSHHRHTDLDGGGVAVVGRVGKRSQAAMAACLRGSEQR
jgi:hypothetical protein